MKFLFSSYLRSNIFLSTLFSHTLNLRTYLTVRTHVSQPYKIADNIIIVCYFNLDAGRQKLWTEW
jgi:hypothetical protein